MTGRGRTAGRPSRRAAAECCRKQARRVARRATRQKPRVTPWRRNVLRSQARKLFVLFGIAHVCVMLAAPGSRRCPALPGGCFTLDRTANSASLPVGRPTLGALAGIEPTVGRVRSFCFELAAYTKHERLAVEHVPRDQGPPRNVRHRRARARRRSSLPLRWERTCTRSRYSRGAMPIRNRFRVACACAKDKRCMEQTWRRGHAPWPSMRSPAVSRKRLLRLAAPVPLISTARGASR